MGNPVQGEISTAPTGRGCQTEYRTVSVPAPRKPKSLEIPRPHTVIEQDDHQCLPTSRETAVTAIDVGYIFRSRHESTILECRILPDDTHSWPGTSRSQPCYRTRTLDKPVCSCRCQFVGVVRSSIVCPTSIEAVWSRIW